MREEITFDKFIRWIGIGSLVLLVLFFVGYLSNVLLPFFIAWLFAYLLYPIVKFVQYKMHVKVRALAIMITMAGVFAVLGGILWLIIPPMIDQIDKVSDILSRWAHDTAHTNNISGWIQRWILENQANIEHYLKSNDFQEIMKPVMPKLAAVVGHTA